MPKFQKISPMLWFDGNAEEAANFYTSIFKNSRVTDVMRNVDGVPGPKGGALLVSFELDGLQFTALNGGPNFKFTEAISLVVMCDDQQEVDTLWSKLTGDGGQEVQCGWLKDKYGLSWQIVPKAFMEMVKDKDAKKVERVMGAMMQMVKFDIKKLEAAYEGH